MRKKFKNYSKNQKEKRKYCYDGYYSSDRAGVESGNSDEDDNDNES